MAVVGGGESGGAVRSLHLLLVEGTSLWGSHGVSWRDLCQLSDAGKRNGCLGVIWELLGLKGW